MNYPFPIPRVRKPTLHPTIDPYIHDYSGNSSLTVSRTASSVSLHETPISDVPVIQVTDPTDQQPHLSVNNIGQRGRASSDSNLLAPQANEDRQWLRNSLDPNSAVGHTHQHTFHGQQSGPHLLVYQQHSAKALVAEPPQANKDEVARARSKLWASNPHLHM